MSLVSLQQLRQDAGKGKFLRQNNVGDKEMKVRGLCLDFVGGP